MVRAIWAITFIAACSLCFLPGCSNSDRPTGPSPAAPSSLLSLSVSNGEAELIRAVGGYTAIGYRWCYNVAMSGPLPAPIVTIQRAENTVLGPDAAVYRASAATFQGDRIGGTGTFGYVGCPTMFEDRDLSRPIATHYRMRIDYTVEGRAETFSVTASGTFASKVPVAAPQMLGIAITDDNPDPQNIIRNRAPVTFAVSGIGGVRPYHYRWRIADTLLRDWHPEATLTWDLTLNGQPVRAGAYTVSVSARSDGGTEAETSATLTVVVLN